MGGGAGVRWKFWLDSVELVYHPYSRKETGVLVPAFQPKLLEFEAFGSMDGMQHVRGDLFEVTSFEVVVTEEKRQDVRAQFDYWHEGAGAQQRFCLHKRDTYESDCSYEMLIWGGYIRGDIKNVVFDLEGDVEMDAFGYSPAVTWSCRLEPQPLFYSWWRAVFEDYRFCEDQLDAEDLWDDIVYCYRLPKKEWNGR